MRTYFKNLKLSGTYTPRFLLTAILPASVAIALGVGLIDCSGKSSMFSSGSNGRLQLIQVPIQVNRVASQHSNLELWGSSDGLDLVQATGSSLKIEVSGCATGYTFGSATTGSPGTAGTIITSGVVNLYNGDRGCIVKLHSFISSSDGATAFTDATSGITGSVPFSAWTAGQVATFSNITSGTATAAQLLNVFVITAVSSPVSGASTIVYQFTDINAGATNTLSQGQVSTAVPLSAVGKAAPNYGGSNTVTGGVAFARYLSTNTDGSGNMSFTIACASAVTGSSPNFTCPNTDGSGDIQNGNSGTTQEIQYTMVPDNYNACVSSSPTTLTVANANTILAGSVFTGQVVSRPAITLSAASGGGLTSAGAGQIAANGTDNYANGSITNGGFDTTLMLTGATPIYSGASGTYANGFKFLNDVLIIQRQDSAANTLSYLYWCINIAAITQD